MGIECPPAGNQSVAVNATSMTMCVQGSLGGWSQLHHRGLALDDPGPVVFVTIVSGSVGAQADPPSQGLTQAAVAGQTWCAINVPVPGPASALQQGTQLTALAWQIDTGGTVEFAWAQPFIGLDSTVGGSDCCSGCPSGSLTALSGALVGVEVLVVSVAEGEHAGDYLATAVDVQQWRLTVRDQVYAITVCSAGRGLILTGPGVKLRSTDFELEPFSATFEGDLFECGPAVVVTLP